MSETHEIDCVVIGAGVVGLAVARALAVSGREVVILERHGTIGSETSSRNSEVIHAGLYYPEGSLKAALCVEGRERLYAHLEARGLPYRRLGKLIVASEAGDLPRLEAIAARASANGVRDLAALDRAAMQALEPALKAEGALLSPSTGIVDSHALMLSLLGEAEAHGAMLALSTPVAGGEANGRLEIRAAGTAPATLKARAVVNAAGLHAPFVSALIEGVPAATIPPAHFAKGSYFGLIGRAPFSRLVYPVPEPGGLGVHLTLDLGGEARFGPDVEWLDADTADAIDYAVEPARAAPFYAAIRRYWPALPDHALAPAYAGVRPKTARAAEQDFVISTEAEHGIPGYVALYAIESPGLTASLAIAERVAAALSGKGA